MVGRGPHDLADRSLRVAGNALWLGLCLPEHVAFRQALRDVPGTQWKLLQRLLSRNANTEFGRRYGFATIRAPADYQARVPLSSYEDYQDAIGQIEHGGRNLLTRSPVLLMEPTSGSTAATKHIPYTAALKAEFRRAIAPWIADLYTHYPALLAGQAYWSVTPVARHGERTPGGLPVGFEDDAEYFGSLERWLIQGLLAVPPAVRLINDVETFRYVTLLFLLRSRSLALISVWNPTFLTLLVGGLSGWWQRLVEDLRAGTIRPPRALAPELNRLLRSRVRPDAGRAAEVERACRAIAAPGELHARLWPRLRVISCWADGYAAPDAAELASLFPQAELQAKGLLATEAAVSFPLVGRAGAALAIRSHFLEFLPADDSPSAASTAAPFLAHQLEPGRPYSVVVTTGGGLYRYRLHDLVQVVGRVGSCPLVRFVSKEAHVSDRFGEKLHARHVERALAELFSRHGIRPAFAMLAYEDEADVRAYTLFVEAEQPSAEMLRSLGIELENALRENYHYRYCRDLGQLGPLRVFRIDRDARDTYLETCRAAGQRLGDIKPVALHRSGNWSRAFHGRFIHPPAPSASESRSTTVSS